MKEEREFLETVPFPRYYIDHECEDEDGEGKKWLQQLECVATARYLIQFDKDFIRVLVNEGHGTLESSLKEKGEDNSPIDGMESLLLALACEGVNISTPEFVRAIKTTVSAISNNS